MGEEFGTNGGRISTGREMEGQGWVKCFNVKDREKRKGK
jgi:hypothetical protein